MTKLTPPYETNPVRPVRKKPENSPENTLKVELKDYSESLEMSEDGIYEETWKLYKDQ